MRGLFFRRWIGVGASDLSWSRASLSRVNTSAVQATGRRRAELLLAPGACARAAVHGTDPAGRKVRRYADRRPCQPPASRRPNPVGLPRHGPPAAPLRCRDRAGQPRPQIVFTGANAPTTIEQFPRWEAVYYREHAIALGVPAEVISIGTEATNTSETSPTAAESSKTRECGPNRCC